MIDIDIYVMIYPFKLSTNLRQADPEFRVNPKFRDSTMPSKISKYIVCFGLVLLGVFFSTTLLPSLRNVCLHSTCTSKESLTFTLL